MKENNEENFDVETSEYKKCYSLNSDSFNEIKEDKNLDLIQKNSGESELSKKDSLSSLNISNIDIPPINVPHLDKKNSNNIKDEIGKSKTDFIIRRSIPPLNENKRYDNINEIYNDNFKFFSFVKDEYNEEDDDIVNNDLTSRYDYEDSFDEYIFSVLFLSTVSSCIWILVINIFSDAFVSLLGMDQIYINVMKLVKGLNSAEAATLYGIYSGKTLVILNIPIAISAAVSAAVIPTVSAAFARKNMEDTKQKVALAIQTTMLIAIPAAVGLGVLARPVTQLLFPQPESLDLAASLLRTLSISVVFYSLSTLTNAVLQGVGLVNRPVIHALIALAAQTAALVPMLLLTELNLYSMVLATVIYTFIMCLLNQISIIRAIGYSQEIMRTFILPGVSAMIMGIVSWAVYSMLYGLFESNVVSLAAAIVMAVIVYFALLLFTGAVDSETLRQMPGGRKIAGIADKMRLLRN